MYIEYIVGPWVPTPCHLTTRGQHQPTHKAACCPSVGPPTALRPPARLTPGSPYVSPSAPSWVMYSWMVVFMCTSLLSLLLLNDSSGSLLPLTCCFSSAAAAAATTVSIKGPRHTRSCTRDRSSQVINHILLVCQSWLGKDFFQAISLVI